MSKFVERRRMDGQQVETDLLTADQIMAAAFCVAHMTDKHGYSSIVSRSGARVPLEELYDALIAVHDSLVIL